MLKTSSVPASFLNQAPTHGYFPACSGNPPVFAWNILYSFKTLTFFPNCPYTHWNLPSWLGPLGSFLVISAQMHSPQPYMLPCSDSEVIAILNKDFASQVYCEYSGPGGCIFSLFHHCAKALEPNMLWVRVVSSAVSGPSSPLSLLQGRALWKETIAVRVSAYHWSLGDHPFLRITWEGQIVSLWLRDDFPEVVRNSYKGH